MADILLLVLIVVILTALGLLALGWFLDRRRRAAGSPREPDPKNGR